MSKCHIVGNHMSRLNYDIPVAVKQIQALAKKHSISYEEGRVSVHFYTVSGLIRMLCVLHFQNFIPCFENKVDSGSTLIFILCQ